MTTHGGKRRGAGRPRGSTKPGRKVPISTKLPPWLVEWLRAQERPQAQLIEEALIEHYHLTAPGQS